MILSWLNTSDPVYTHLLLVVLHRLGKWLHHLTSLYAFKAVGKVIRASVPAENNILDPYSIMRLRQQ